MISYDNEISFNINTGQHHQGTKSLCWSGSWSWDKMASATTRLLALIAVTPLHETTKELRLKCCYDWTCSEAAMYFPDKHKLFFSKRSQFALLKVWHIFLALAVVSLRSLYPRLLHNRYDCTKLVGDNHSFKWKTINQEHSLNQVKLRGCNLMTVVGANPKKDSSSYCSKHLLPFATWALSTIGGSIRLETGLYGLT